MDPAIQTDFDKVPAPQKNSYKTSMAATVAAVRAQTAARGHNTFRPDIYRVSEGYIA